MSRILACVGNALRLVLSWLVGLLLLAIVLFVCIQAFSRYFIGAPTPEMAELSRLLFIWLTFIGSALLISRRELIVIDFLHDRLSTDYFQRLGLIIDLATAVFLITLAFFANRLIGVVGQKVAPATGLPFGWFYISVLVFCCLGLFFIAERLVSPSARLDGQGAGEQRSRSIQESLT